MSSNPSSLPLGGADIGGPSSANGSGPARYDTLAPSASSASNRADRRPSQQPSNASPRHPSSRHGDDGPRADDRSAYADKGVPTSKIYIGGLPTDTEYADLDACFGKSGKIVNIELKAGFGFVVRRRPSPYPPPASPRLRPPVRAHVGLTLLALNWPSECYSGV